MKIADVERFAEKICFANRFELFIAFVIVLNSIFIGVETYREVPVIFFLQNVILGIFTFEILLRYVAVHNAKTFFSSAWNIFDLVLVLVCYIPESVLPNTSAMMAIRVLRVFRVLRLLRASKEIKLIVSVLLKSTSSMFYNMVLFFIFIYLFAIIGVNLFRLPDVSRLNEDELVAYTHYVEAAPNSPINSPDPYGTLDEAMFTLFRAMTGEDWTDLRYNLITASQYGVINVPTFVITIFHVLWFFIAVFLLLNLVTGAIINNYQMEKDKQETGKGYL